MSNQQTTITYIGGFPQIRVASIPEVSLKRGEAGLIAFDVAVKLHRQCPSEWQVNQDVHDAAFPPAKEEPPSTATNQ